ncbi:thioesterase II family protein [Streptomyces sp. NPDC057620]|uniref:Thioesterase n=1 Tax=Streptomyces liliiviolaceus TaxID=2823109 RepID=A0A940Y614_9ACTN|nr:alpha/beta fold hydrolase [Streptomyces liliiviolaceus]MBQ0853731.1 thioesterase [Streptomyces liliiviolaceus]
MNETGTGPRAPGRASADGGWLRRFHEGRDTATRLICLPHAGGSASFFFPLSAGLAPDVEVLAVQYPGRQDRRHEPCLDSVSALTDALTEELRGRLDRPFALLGHSMGASVAFETARRLEAAGSGPQALYVSGRRAPTLPHDKGIHLADDATLVAHIGALSGTDARILDDPEVLELVLPAIRADYRAAETYRYVPGPPLSCPLFVLTGDQDSQVTPAQARGWASHTAGAHELTVLSGGHFYLSSHWGRVAELVRGRLVRSGAS